MGSVVISLDAELGWGFHDLDRPPSDRVESGRRGWERLCSLFETYDVPATWAVVGHLFLDECDGKHDDHPAPPEWFERERTAWRERPDLRYGPDLVHRILDAPVEHELASHTFSHVLFGDPETTPEMARAELDRSVELARRWGLSLDSLVFPRNDVGHREQLAAAGFRAYRGWTPTPTGVRWAAETVVRGRSQLVRPTVDEYGLVNVPASTFCFGFEGLPRTVAETVWTDPMVAQARRGIDEATAADEGVFHLWLHPNNLVTERDEERMRAIVEHVARRREDGLRVETMGDVAARVLDEAPERDLVGSASRPHFPH